MTDPQPSCSEIAIQLTTKILKIKNDALFPTACSEIIQEALLAKQKTIEDLRAGVERLKKPAYEYECPSCKTIMSPHSRKFLRNELSRLRSALKKIVRNWPCDNNECGRIAKQALSKTWEEVG